MDIEGELLSRFSTLGTTDHDVLIAEFRKFVGDQTPDASCAFFLDMNNWSVLNRRVTSINYIVVGQFFNWDFHIK